MKFLWAPWRLNFILNEKEKGCVFCAKVAENDDRKNLILHRGKLNYIILNLFPYNNGHLMVVPYRHFGDLTELTADEGAEMMALTQKSVAAITERFHPQGFNVGMNLGAAAGAGIADHLHMHLVPRWNGDTNFMPVLAETKVMPQHIESTYDSLKEVFSRF
ncbi:MAG: HIT domain-containing protein [Nitrospinae bacterium]|nr:HIT domain-containing protein [Nitrospinota bacterium]